jgi:ketosteroid isomerase-like protein
MRTLLGAMIVVLFLTVVAGCASCGNKCAAVHPDQAKIDAAKKLDADFTAAFNRQDVDAVVACYWNSPEVVLYPPGAMECRGPQQIHDAVAQVFSETPGGKIELMDAKYTVTGCDVISDGRWTMTSSSGQAMQGRFTEVIAKKDGKWVIVVDHASVPMADGK